MAGHDLKFEAFFEEPAWTPRGLPPFVSFGLSDVASTYSENLGLAISLGYIAGNLFMHGHMWAECHRWASEQLGESSPLAERNALATDAFFKSIRVPVTPQSIALFAQESSNALKFSSLTPRGHSSMHSLLKGMITGAWTAFEVLAEDLHSTVRQAYAMAFNPADYAAKYYFLKRHLMRDAYDRAFQSDPEINLALGNRRIDELCLLRNLIVHKRGRVDGRFCDDCEKATLLPYSTPENITSLKKWAAYTPQHEFEFDGALVCLLLDGTRKAAYELLSAVDKWIQNHNPI